MAGKQRKKKTEKSGKSGRQTRLPTANEFLRDSSTFAGNNPIATIVIPQRGNVRLTERAIDGIRQHEEQQVEIVVVDDSEDPQKPRGCARFTVNKGRGVTAAWNSGVEKAHSPKLILLNNDVIITKPFVEKVVKRLSQQQAIMGCEWRTETAMMGNKLPRKQWLSGWMMAFDISIYNRLHGFDELMELYFSDLDFQLRAVGSCVELVQHKFGITHLQHRTAHDPKLCPERQRRWSADRRVFLRKHFP